MTRLWLSLVVLPVAVGCGTGSSTSSSDQPTRSDRGARAGSSFPLGVRLATGKTADGRVLELRVFRDDAGPCLLVRGVDAEVRGCGRVRLEREGRVRRAVLAEATVARRGADHHEIFAATSARVARVRVRIGKAELSARRGVLLRADNAASLHAAGIESGPFGYFFAEIPRTTRAVRIIALDASGNVIGSDDFDHLSGLGERFIVG